MELQEWANSHEPNENLIYKNGYWEQIIFVRDTISPLFVNSYKEYEQSKKEVVSTHTSKSVLLPVYKITFPIGLTLIMRYNFYDWKVSVDSPKEIDVDFHNLFNPNEKIQSCYFEGATDEIIYDSYSNNKKKFTVELNSGFYNIYTFMWLCSKALNIEYKG